MESQLTLFGLHYNIFQEMRITLFDKTLPPQSSFRSHCQSLPSRFLCSCLTQPVSPFLCFVTLSSPRLLLSTLHVIRFFGSFLFVFFMKEKIEHSCDKQERKLLCVCPSFVVSWLLFSLALLWDYVGVPSRGSAHFLSWFGYLHVSSWSSRRHCSVAPGTAE